MTAVFERGEVVLPSHPAFRVAIDPPAAPPDLAGAVVAIGNFDGMHRGHQAVIGRARDLARRLGRPCVVLTFEPHPVDVFAGRPVVFRLTPLPAKALALARLGTADGMIVRRFDRDFAALTAEDFVERILVGQLGVSAAVVGYDFHFGRGRAGSPAFLRRSAAMHGFGAAVIERIDADERGTLETVSSTAIRGLLETGDVGHAAILLGHRYFVLGTVVHGRRMGRTLGFPTANVALEETSRLRHGIYAVEVVVGGVRHGGVASFGRRPTFDNGPPLLETFLFDFDGDLYGRTIEVGFVAWIRGEEKFDAVEALVARMTRDADEARAILASS